MKTFKIAHNLFKDKIHSFDETTAPQWLKFGGFPGSTMDNRWFWETHVLTLEVGESVETDFNIITRVT